VSLVTAGLLGLWPVAAASKGPAPPEPVVLRTDGAGIVVEWSAPDFSLHQVTGNDGRPYSVLETPGWMQIEEPGQPQLPFASALAVVPPTGEVALHVQVLEDAWYALLHPVIPARAPVPVGNPPTGFEWTWARDEQTYAGAGPHPADVVTLEEAGWLRGRRLVRLTFYPLRFDPAEGTLEIARQARVELRFQAQPFNTAQDETASEDGWDYDDPFISILQNGVINPAQVTHFTRPARMASASAAPPGAGPTALASPGIVSNSNPRYKLIVSREGVYALTRDALIAAGIPVTTTPRTAYRLEHAGEEVAYQWEGDSDGAFEPGERILFYARPTPTRFADYDVYWLTVGVTGTSMAVRVGNPDSLPQAIAWTTAVAEQNRNYLSSWPSGRDGDHWYWDRVYWDYATKTGVRDMDFSVTLATPDSSASNATLRVHLQGSTRSDSANPDHCVEVRLNNSTLGTARWDGKVYYTATFSPAASLLRVGSNTIRLHLPANCGSSGTEEAWLDAIELRYGVRSVSGSQIRAEGKAGPEQYTIGGFGSGSVRIYDVTSLTATQVVTGFTASSGNVTFGDATAGTATYYLLTDNQIATPDQIVPARTLADPPAGANYLIIAHSNFITAVAPLASHHAISDGLRVFSTTVEAVYDTYGDGRTAPGAIERYIAHAYQDWMTPTLKYVLLVGDGTRDPLNRAQSPHPGQTFIPPYLLMMDPPWPHLPTVEPDPWEAASDNRFVTVDGTDNLADISIARLPVNTVAQATTVVNKILAYNLNPPQWPWNERVLFFAGNELDAPYHQYSDEVYATLPITYTGQRVYFCTSGCNQPHLYPTMPAAHDATVRELTIGGLLASYVGHSSWHQWAVDPQTYAPMFHLNDVASLHNGGALPVVLEMTCYTSDFSDPAGDTLDETLLRQPGGGAVATWGPTTLGLSVGHNVLHQEFFDAVFKENTTELGAATEEAKLALFTLGNPYLDLLNTFILFGDPAMDLNLNIVPWTHEVFLPATLRNK